MSIWKKSLFVLLFSLLLGVATFLLAEIALRMLYPLPWYGCYYVPPQQHLFQFDPEIGWVGRPNAEGLFASLDFAHIVHHDKYGFRNQNPPYVPGKKNVLILADSFGWGWGVSDDAVFSCAMMEMNPGLNVYNLSAPGYGTDQEYLTMKRFLESHPEYRPEAVIVLVCDNDFRDVTSTNPYAYPKAVFALTPDGSLILKGVPIANTATGMYEGKRRSKRAPQPLWRSSHLLNLLNYYAEKGSLPHTAPRVHVPHSKNHGQEYRVKLVAALLGAINRLAKSRGGFLFVAMVFPEKADRRIVELRAALDAQRIPHGTFERTVIPLNELWRDHHMNAYGHRSLARHVLSWIGDRLL